MSTASRSSIALAIATLGMMLAGGGGCNGSFRFDETPLDAGAADGSDASSIEGGDGASVSSYSNCMMDSDCVIASLHCDPFSGACFECVTDANCTASAPRCDAAIHRCVECGVDIDCPAAASGAQMCEGTTRSCIVKCTTDGSSSTMCPTATPICSETKLHCVECERDDDCEHKGSKIECDPLTGRCSECDRDAECPTERPRCDRIHDQCVQCTGSGDCPSATPLCDPNSYTCVAAQ